MIHVFTQNFTETQVIIDGDSFKHLKNVLRVAQGDDILVSDGSGRDVIASVAEIGSSEIVADIIKERDAAEMPELPVQLVLYQALPKADKMELIIQKCTELGVARIVPVETSRCVVKLDSKTKYKKLERWQKIAQSAAEQSQRSIVPIIGPVMSWKEALKAVSAPDTIEMEDATDKTDTIEKEDAADKTGSTEKAGTDSDSAKVGKTDVPKTMSFIPYELETGVAGLRELMHSDYLGCHTLNILIGPEGGFTREEVDAAEAAGVKPISLGRRILRTETAGMALIAALMLKIESETGERL